MMFNYRLQCAAWLHPIFEVFSVPLLRQARQNLQKLMAFLRAINTKAVSASWCLDVNRLQEKRLQISLSLQLFESYYSQFLLLLFFSLHVQMFLFCLGQMEMNLFGVRHSNVFVAHNMEFPSNI